MTNKRTTKRALLLSVLALVLAITMLMGTTYAWFTDSVTSANNIIKSGSLDIELEYLTEDGWKTVEGASDILTNENFEPGATEVAYLRIANAGSLALKYQLGINIVSETEGVNKAGKAFKLSDYIMFGAVESDKFETYANREDAVAAVKEDAKKISAGYTKASSMLAEDEMFIALVVYMPETVGNEANHNGTAPQIDLGINVVATQYSYETDSFDKYYDGATAWTGAIDTDWYDATKTELVIGTAEELAGFAAIVNGTASVKADTFAGKTIKLVSNIDLAGKAWTPIGDPDSDGFVGFEGTFDGQGHTISNLYVNESSWARGLFGLLYWNAKEVATIKNVNVDKATVIGEDTSGVIAGYAYKGNFSNITVTNSTVIGTSDAEEAGHVGGIAGCGYFASFENCTVSKSTITSAGSFVGGIVGYQSDKTKTTANCKVSDTVITGDSSVGGVAGIIAGGATVTGCTVENVDLYKTRAVGLPKIGAVIGCYDGTSLTNLSNNTLTDVTLNGTAVEFEAFDVRSGAEYDGKNTTTFDLTGTSPDGVANYLNTVVAATPDTIQSMIDNAAAGAKIGLAAGDYDTTIVMKSNITLYGTANAIVSCINLNGADNVTLKNITFDAAGAQLGYDYAGTEKQYANIITGDTTNKPTKGSHNVVIDGCTFTGTFKKAGAAIAFADQKRPGGFSGNITIKNCTFDTAGGNYDIYGHYTGDSNNGHGNFVIENNTFATEKLVAGHIFLGRYASNVPVVVTGNTFENVTSLAEAMYVQDHSSYGVSINPSNNTFAE